MRALGSESRDPVGSRHVGVPTADPGPAAADAAQPVLHGVRKGDFRADIEGMRSIAVLLVVAAHAGLSFVPGGFVGVDVFFVLSGFLITRLLVAELRREGRIFLPDFWGRRARRLLPASTLVLLAVVLVSYFKVDASTQLQTGRDVTAAALFVANWWFATQSVDYFAMDVDRSPVLHFWSLSLEEQFYVFWPPMLALLCWHLSKRAWRMTRILRISATLLAVVSLVTFAYSLWATSSSPVMAYYSTFTRAWELGAGGLLAIVTTLGLRVPRGLSAPLGVTGVVLVLAAALFITEETPFPGRAALLPVLGTVAILFAGSGDGGRGGVGRWLGVRPMVWLGGRSYSWYLWHWPFLILAPYFIGDLNGWKTTLVVLASLGMAALCYRYVENPVRRHPLLARRVSASLLLGAALITVSVAAGQYLSHRAVAQAESSGITPAPAVANRDLTQAHADACQLGYADTVSPACTYAKVGSDRKLVMLGDSHSTQWFPAIEPLAQDLGAELVVFGKSSCMPIGVTYWSGKLGRPYTECDTWQSSVMDRIAAMPKGSVIIYSGRNDYRVATEDGQRASRATGEEAIADGYADTVAKFEEMGMVVVPLRDVPHPPEDPVTCVSAHLDDPSSCDFPRPADSRGTSWEESVLADAGLGRTVLDLNGDICAPEVCRVVVDRILRWRDEDHITATFAAMLADPFAQRFSEALPEAFGESTKPA